MMDKLSENAGLVKPEAINAEDLKAEALKAEALEAIYQKGYTVKFSLIPAITIGTWEDFRGKFGF